MSVQILSERHYASIYKTLTAYLDAPQKSEYVYLIHAAREAHRQPCSMREFLLALILDMYELNCLAYTAEYNESTDDLLTCGMILSHGILLEPVHLYKALSAWRYNSVDSIGGDVRSYKRVTPGKIENILLAVDLTGKVAEAIVRRSEDYDIAKWSL